MGYSLFLKDENQSNSLIQKVRNFVKSTTIESGLSKCGTPIMESGKFVTNKGTEINKWQIMKTIEVEFWYKYLGTIGTDGIKHNEKTL